MNRVVNFLFLLLLFNFVNGQEWTEPVIINPTQSQYYSVYPDFCVDNQGNIHCVWSTMHGTNFYIIYYSKSTDNGETWSNPVSVSMNSTQWMSEPHIVSDNEGKLHLTYDGNVGSYPNKTIIYKFYDGNTWSDPDTLNKGYIGAMHNRLIIDNNDRIYCFWFIGASTGNTYCRFHNANQTDWSEVIKVYDSVFFEKIVVDGENNLHAVGVVMKFNYSWYKMGYFKCVDDVWDSIVEISPETHGNTMSIDIDQNNEPHIIWQHKPPSSPQNDTIYYTYKSNNTWLYPQDILIESDYLALCIDQNSETHVALTFNPDVNFYLLDIEKKNGNWISDTISINNYTFYHTKMLFKNNTIYMIYGIVDTINGSTHTNFIFRTKQILTDVYKKVNQLWTINVFPNPCVHEIYFSLIIPETQFLQTRIYDLRGTEVKSLFDGKVESSEIIIKWDCKDRSGDNLKKGIYLLNIQTEKLKIIKEIILQ